MKFLKKRKFAEAFKLVLILSLPSLTEEILGGSCGRKTGKGVRKRARYGKVILLFQLNFTNLGPFLLTSIAEHRISVTGSLLGLYLLHWQNFFRLWEAEV